MQQGEYSRLLNAEEEGGHAAWQFVDKDRAVLCIYQDWAQPNPQPWRVKMVGLEADAMYADAEHGLRCSGAALMNIGVPVPRPEQDHESWVYCFEKE